MKLLIYTFFFCTFFLSSALSAQFGLLPSDGCTGIPQLTVHEFCTIDSQELYEIPIAYTPTVAAPSCLTRTSFRDGWFSFVAESIVTDIRVDSDQGFAISVWDQCGGTASGATELACAFENDRNGGFLSIQMNTTIGTRYFLQIVQHRGSGDPQEGLICVHKSVVDPSLPSIIPTTCATQTFPITGSTNFFDDGGAGGNHCAGGFPGNHSNSNCTTTTTLCAPAGLGLTIDFSLFAIKPEARDNNDGTYTYYDWLKIYDGANTTSPILFDNSCATCLNAFGGFGGFGDCGDDLMPSFCTSNACLTFEFFATDRSNRAGWDALVQLIVLDGSCNVLLDNDLVRFDVTRKGIFAEINWSLENENNIDNYTIQRSEDGLDWETIDNRTATNTQDITSYTVTDESPKIGVNYYRIVQKTIEGKKKYSYIKALEWSENSTKQIRISPNPVSNLLSIHNLDMEESTSIKVYNLVGRDLSSQVYVTQTNANSTSINTQQLPSGVYILKTTTGSYRFIKQ